MISVNLIHVDKTAPDDLKKEMIKEYYARMFQMTFRKSGLKSRAQFRDAMFPAPTHGIELRM